MRWVKVSLKPDGRPGIGAIHGRVVEYTTEALNRLIREVWPDYGTHDILLAAAPLWSNSHGYHELVIRKNTNHSSEGVIWFVFVDPPKTLKKGLQLSKNIDPVTARLMQDALPRHGKDSCPRCSSGDLKQVKTALVCQWCGTLVGGF